jgi:hypothetical protein
MNAKGIIQLAINLAIMLFGLYSYLWVAENIGFERALLVLLFFSFLGLGGTINTVAQSIQKTNFKALFTEDDLVEVVLALRTAREKEEKKLQRNQFLERELKFLSFLEKNYNYKPKKGAKEILAEESDYNANRSKPKRDATAAVAEERAY